MVLKHKQEMWKKLKRSVSLFEIKIEEAVNYGGYFKCHFTVRKLLRMFTRMDVEAWALSDYGRIPPRRTG